MMIGVAKNVKLAECGLIGGLRNFFLVLTPNVVFAFWAVCMWVNFRSTQPASKDLSKVNTLQRQYYLALLTLSVAFIFLNNMAVKYNSDVYCRKPENY
mmetsp:Transcript_4130/g.5092  ORF Transcript_4130/g.5092 Transcript_4130/m.5092 type:complete len:98 (+) Transcript_4130:426-719(+)